MFKLARCMTQREGVIAKDRQEEIIRYYHESKMNHRGMNQIETQIRKSYHKP